MKNRIFSSAFILGAILIFVQCNKKQTLIGKSPNLPAQTYDYSLSVHDSSVLKTGVNNLPSNNAITDDGATLGRVLFYDPKMSINNSTSCGSCHHQANAFADPVAFSNGFEGNKTSRNASTIMNVINQNSYFWDARTVGLETMVLQPIRHQVEMGMEKPEILTNKLKTVNYYPVLFKNAFGSEEITAERISMALSQFLRSLTNYDSKADQTGLANIVTHQYGNTLDPRVTPSEKNGAQLFSSLGCKTCHTGINLRGMGDDGFANIGLELNYTDKGLGETDPSKVGMFKVPSLRNVGITAPYMHDGRFATLKDVVNHYSSQVVDHPNLASTLRNSSWGGGDNLPRKLNLTEQQKDDIVAFLNTLTDESTIGDIRFSDPFK